MGLSCKISLVYVSSPKVRELVLPKSFVAHRLFLISGLCLAPFLLFPFGIKNLILHHLLASIILGLFFVFHLGFGLILLFHSGKGGSIHYLLQRITGILAALYVLLQIAEALLQFSLLPDLFYQFVIPIGTLALCFYFAQAFWYFLVDWGILASPFSQKTGRQFCWGLFFILSLWHFLIIFKVMD